MPPLASADLLGLAPVIPVVILDEPASAVPLAEALLAGGVPIIEVTLRTPRALEVIRAIAGNLPGAVIGAGTVTTPGLVRQAVDAGARFLVSPGTTDRLLDAMDEAGVPYLPGVASASEVMRVLERGQREMKFFPAEASGGRAFLSAMASPFPDARFCPTGGITPATAPLYRELNNVGCVGGSWLTPRDAIAARDWRVIEKLAAEAVQPRHDASAPQRAQPHHPPQSSHPVPESSGPYAWSPRRLRHFQPCRPAVSRSCVIAAEIADTAHQVRAALASVPLAGNLVTQGTQVLSRWPEGRLADMGAVD
jgi:2-dehydro-3-deoxyphosphogluconate aldolase / (4S)-4-hydroxy-2-oxoglutarate aldolase